MVDAANDEIIRKGGASDKLLESVIEGIEIFHSVPVKSYQRLKEMNIILQK